MFEMNADANLIAHLIVDHHIAVDELKKRFDDLTLSIGAARAMKWQYPDGVPDDVDLPEGMEWLREQGDT